MSEVVEKLEESKYSLKDISCLVNELSKVKVTEVKGFFSRLIEAADKNIRFLEASDYSDFLLKVDILNKTIEDKILLLNALQFEREELYEKTLELDSALTKANNEVIGLKANRSTDFEVITSQNKTIAELRKQVTYLEDRLEVKSGLLDEKSKEFAALTTCHDKTVNKLKERNSRISELEKDLKDISANINNKITEGIRLRCKNASHDMIKEDNKKKKDEARTEVPNSSKHTPVKHPEADERREEAVKEIKEGKAQVILAGSKFPVEVILDIRTRYNNGEKKFEIADSVGICRSVINRICNDQTYKEAKYYPTKNVATPSTDAVTDTVVPKPTEPHAFKKKVVKRRKK